MSTMFPDPRVSLLFISKISKVDSSKSNESLWEAGSIVKNIIKGALKAHIHISLYESNTLQEQDAALLFLSVIPWGEIFAYCHHPA